LNEDTEVHYMAKLGVNSSPKYVNLLHCPVVPNIRKSGASFGKSSNLDEDGYVALMV